MMYKCENTIFGGMKRFQVRENSSQQIIVVPTKAIKKLQKDTNIRPIKHDFAWCIVYKQHVANMKVEIFTKKNIKVFMKIWLVRFISQEMWILHVELLIKYFRMIHEFIFFMPNLIQIIIDIVTLGCELNIHMELPNTSIQEFI
jgi:hypothetical protein